MLIYLQRAARLVLALELPLLGLITFAFWYPSPIRDQWLWLLYLLIPIYVARLIVYRRLWTWTPLTPWLLGYVILVVINIALGLSLAADGSASAPYTRGWIMLGRPLLGLGIFIACVEYARTHHTTQGLITRSVWFALGLGLLALGATQWPDKAKQFAFITDALPRVGNFPGAEGGFNANEIAGALAWVVPLMAGVAFYRWREKLPRRDEVTIATLLIGMAIFLGQSRAALLGVLMALAILCWFLLRRYWRFVGIIAVFGVGVLQIASVAFVPVSTSADANRDTAAGNVTAQADESIAPRLRIWQTALEIIRDHPLTGVGISFFRYEPVRSLYPVPDVDPRVLVHTHNEVLQVGTDLGVPGLLVYVAWYIAALYTLWFIWKRGDGEARAVALAVCCGLLAHSVFGLADAIPLSDRFAFLYWWMFGILGAQYAVVKEATQETTKPQSPT
jgi:O-antigen ligase